MLEKQTDPWGSLARESSLLVKLSAGERPYLKSKVDSTWGETHSADIWPSHTCTHKVCTLGHTHAARGGDFFKRLWEQSVIRFPLPLEVFNYGPKPRFLCISGMYAYSQNRVSFPFPKQVGRKQIIQNIVPSVILLGWVWPTFYRGWPWMPGRLLKNLRFCSFSLCLFFSR